MSPLQVLVMAVAMAQAKSTSPPAEEHTCLNTKDQRSLISNMLKMTGYSDICVAAALKDCSTGQGETRYSAFIEEARKVVQQLSAAASTWETQMSAAMEKWESQFNAVAATTWETQMNAAMEKWGSQFSAAAAGISKSLPQHCHDLRLSGDSGSGMRDVYPYRGQPNLRVSVFCKHTVDGGGWTVVQRRTSDASRQDFYRNWSDYKSGFGDLLGEFFLGLDVLHQLTSITQHQLRIDLEDYEGDHRWAKYGNFSVGSRETNYRLTIGNFSGDAGDSLAVHNGQQFSTYDVDNDSSRTNCAEQWKGAWWYNNCYHSNLNGYHFNNKKMTGGKGIIWKHWKGAAYSLKGVTMMIRPDF